MNRTFTKQEHAERQVMRFFSAIQIPRTTRTNWKEFASAWMMKYGGTFNNAYSVWRVTYREEHSRDISNPYIPLDKYDCTCSEQ
jgi:hypothetical protein